MDTEQLNIMKVGILGGTFNPPHVGHLILAQTMKQALKLEKIIFIPNNRPPHKNIYLSDARHRLNMVKLAIRGNPCFEVLDWEIKQGGVSYTVDSLKFLKGKAKRRVFFLIIGSELANDFHNWRDYKEIKRTAKITVAKRKDSPLKKKNGFIVIEIPQVEITSSMIRKNIERGLSIRYMVPEAVFKYIHKNRLYKGKSISTA